MPNNLVTRLRIFHTDGMDGLRAPTDETGALINTDGTDAFGAGAQQQGLNPQPFGYTGQQADNDGLVYLRARYYDPSTGRFMSRDGFGGVDQSPLTLNRYSYVRNDPTIQVDPSGQLPLPIATGLIGAVVSGGAEPATQLVIHRDDPSQIDLKAVAVSTAVGFGAGFLAGATAEVAQYWTTQAVEGQPITLEGLGESAVTGAVGGLAAGRVVAAEGLRFAEDSPFIPQAFARRLNNDLDVQKNVTLGNFGRTALGAGLADINVAGLSNINAGPATPAAGKR